MMAEIRDWGPWQKQCSARCPVTGVCAAAGGNACGILWGVTRKLVPHEYLPSCF
jgi:hypothetical protein